jgi:hypothetical protein
VNPEVPKIWFSDSSYAKPNQRRQDVATSCGLARTGNDKNVDSNGRTGWRDYSCHCEEARNLKILPQESERNFVSFYKQETYSEVEKVYAAGLNAGSIFVP